jgi:hypothetical protein
MGLVRLRLGASLDTLLRSCVFLSVVALLVLLPAAQYAPGWLFAMGCLPHMGYEPQNRLSANLEEVAVVDGEGYGHKRERRPKKIQVSTPRFWKRSRPKTPRRTWAGRNAIRYGNDLMKPRARYGVFTP